MATQSVLDSLKRARATGRGREALVLAERAAAAGLNDPLVFRVLAEARSDAGRFAEAGALLNRALALAPGDPESLTALGLLLVREGRAEEAVGVLEGALRAASGLAAAWSALGVAFEHLERDEEAATAYRRAAALDPADPAPHAGLGEIARRAGRLEAAAAAAGEALARRRGHPMAGLILARTRLAQGRAEAALSAAEALVIRGGLDPALEPLALKTLGDALDRLDRTGEAERAYERMNLAIVAQNQARFGPGGPVENHFAFMERLGRAYRAGAAAFARPSVPPPQGALAGHVFVLGYPRSGNTLAAAVLGALPGAVVLEERPTLMDADLAFLKDEAALERLAGLDGAALDPFRARYLARAAAFAGPLAGRILIDMSPLNSLKIPLIKRLFPDAGLIHCVRDPLDVVLSCWRQSFRVNAATFQMTSIEGAARHLVQARALASLGAEVSEAKLFALDYEALMDDFEGGARALVAAAGLSWSPEALDFAERAKARSLRTASAGQIQGGLYDGRGQWRRYARALEPAREVLGKAGLL